MSVYNVSTNSTLVEHFSTCLPALYLQRKRSQGDSDQSSEIRNPAI